MQKAISFKSKNCKIHFRIIPLVILAIVCTFAGHQRLLYGSVRRSTNRELTRIIEFAKGLIENNTLHCLNVNMPDAKDIKFSQNRWQTEVSSKGRVYLYSAIFDDRPLAGSHFVRINLMATTYANMTMFCHFWYEGYPNQAYVEQGILNRTGKISGEFKEGEFLEYILSCPVLVSSHLPKFVSVSEENACKPLTTLLPVLHENHKVPPIEFGLCVVNGHGPFTPQEMVEWFEFYRLMGVKEFNLYNTSYRGVDDVLDYYVRNNILVLDQIPHPLGPDDGLLEYSVKKIRNLRITCLNDCMLRNMHRYRYLVVVDHDEFIVPRGNITNFHDLIKESLAAIDAKEEVMSIGFQNTYFFKSFPPDLYKPQHMKTLRFRHRTKPLAPYTSSKSILKPDFCFNIMNHYCNQFLPFYSGKVSYFCPSRLAMSHHYRFCGKFMRTPSCSRLHGERIADDVMLKFEQPFVTNVENILFQLKVPFETWLQLSKIFMY